MRNILAALLVIIFFFLVSGCTDTTFHQENNNTMPDSSSNTSSPGLHSSNEENRTDTAIQAQLNEVWNGLNQTRVQLLPQIQKLNLASPDDVNYLRDNIIKKRILGNFNSYQENLSSIQSSSPEKQILKGILDYHIEWFSGVEEQYRGYLLVATGNKIQAGDVFPEAQKKLAKALAMANSLPLTGYEDKYGSAVNFDRNQIEGLIKFTNNTTELKKGDFSLMDSVSGPRIYFVETFLLPYQGNYSSLVHSYEGGRTVISLGPPCSARSISESSGDIKRTETTSRREWDEYGNLISEEKTEKTVISGSYQSDYQGSPTMYRDTPFQSP
jgi:hypothetical protein